MSEFVNTNKVSVRPIEKSVAKKLIVDNHYSQRWSHCRYALGIFYEDDEHHFFDGAEKLIGCLVYGHPIGNRTVASIVTISDVLNYENTLELTRLWIADGYGKNIESYALSLSFRWLKKNSPTKVLISYSDPEYGHSGIIYQATNWLYQGNELNLVYGHYFRFEPDGEWIHKRTVHNTRKTIDLKTLIESNRGKPVWRKVEAHKHRYLLFLCSKRERKYLTQNLKHPILPYPKNDIFDPQIEKVELVGEELIFTAES